VLWCVGENSPNLVTLLAIIKPIYVTLFLSLYIKFGPEQLPKLVERVFYHECCICLCLANNQCTQINLSLLSVLIVKRSTPVFSLAILKILQCELHILNNAVCAQLYSPYTRWPDWEKISPITCVILVQYLIIMTKNNHEFDPRRSKLF
jgi:hypothetical protein